jgi:hypothetical protein
MGGAVIALGSCAGSGSDTPPDPCAGVPTARTVIAEQLQDPLVNDLAIDDESVFWIDARADLVRRASKAGDSKQTIAQASWPGRIAIDAENVYWVSGLGSVSKVSKTGGDVTVISPDSGCSINSPCDDGIAVDADAVYWVADNHLMSWPKQGGQPIELAAQVYTDDLVVDSVNVYWNAVVLTDRIYSAVRATPKSGGEVQTLGMLPEDGLFFPYAMAGDEANLYVPRWDGVWRVPKDMSGPVLIAPGPYYPRDIATDGVNIYISEEHRILRVPVEGGELVPIACKQEAALHMVVDNTDVYWNAEHVNAILSTPK